MTDNMYFLKKFNVDHTAFGGKIYPSDFDRKTTLSEAAARIEYDKKFDRQCKKNKELNHE